MCSLCVVCIFTGGSGDDNRARGEKKGETRRKQKEKKEKKGKVYRLYDDLANAFSISLASSCKPSWQRGFQQWRRSDCAEELEAAVSVVCHVFLSLFGFFFPSKLPRCVSAGADVIGLRSQRQLLLWFAMCLLASQVGKVRFSMVVRVTRYNDMVFKRRSEGMHANDTGNKLPLYFYTTFIRGMERRNHTVDYKAHIKRRVKRA